MSAAFRDEGAEAPALSPNGLDTGHTSSDELMTLVYEDLRRLADRWLSSESSRQTLQPTALVHEAYLRLSGSSPGLWDNRGHYFGAAARAIRRILIDRARARRRDRRGGGRRPLPLEEAELIGLPGPRLDLVALDLALEKLSNLDEQKSRVVELRFFGGLSVEETAETLGVSPSTVARDWRFARAWLHRELAGSELE